MRKRNAYVLFFILYMSLAVSLVSESPSAQATEIEKWLIMPAPVTASHAEFEADCRSCHAPLSNEAQGALCADCHTEVSDDVAKLSGFHGRLPELQRHDCASCHTDHEGRDMDIVDLDVENFDHTLTDFALHAAHADVSCDGCHADNARHRDAPSGCVDCHRPDDVHQGRFGDDCAACHNSGDWREAKFDHKRTHFPLNGAHKDVSCNACHISDDFAEVGRTCLACHKADDVHKGGNGTQCADCHNSTSWTKTTFNHFATTGFGLIGGHKGLTCDACHRGGDFSSPGNSECISCHRRNDVHEGRFGTDCGSCHSIYNWASMRFDHQRETGFALPTGHNDLECASCHVGKLDAALPTACGTCHADDDVHLGQLKARCESCHASTSWVAEIRFDHDITSFPLVGMHAEVACVECHATPAFHDADSDCASCHFNDDPHQGALGEQCDTCHNPTSWRAWQFNHDVQTSFPLTGSHVNVTCNECHTENMKRSDEVRNDCNSCHRREDPHFGRFGNNCEACHTTSSFTQIEGM